MGSKNTSHGFRGAVIFLFIFKVLFGLLSHCFCCTGFLAWQFTVIFRFFSRKKPKTKKNLGAKKLVQQTMRQHPTHQNPRSGQVKLFHRAPSTANSPRFMLNAECASGEARGHFQQGRTLLGGGGRAWVQKTQVTDFAAL